MHLNISNLLFWCVSGIIYITLSSSKINGYENDSQGLKHPSLHVNSHFLFFHTKFSFFTLITVVFKKNKIFFIIFI